MDYRTGIGRIILENARRARDAARFARRHLDQPFSAAGANGWYVVVSRTLTGDAPWRVTRLRLEDGALTPLGHTDARSYSAAVAEVVREYGADLTRARVLGQRVAA